MARPAPFEPARPRPALFLPPLPARSGPPLLAQALASHPTDAAVRPRSPRTGTGAPLARGLSTREPGDGLCECVCCHGLGQMGVKPCLVDATNILMSGVCGERQGRCVP